MANVHPVVQPIMKDADDKMQKSLEKMRQEFSSLRSGRASAAILDHVKVECYGSLVPLKQVAAVGVPDGRTLEVKPWDAGSLLAIEKAIRQADLGLNPNNDGKMIRLTVPTLTEDRRKEMVKAVKKVAEEFRVAVRNDRHDALERIRKSEKEKLITQDDLKVAEESLQRLTNLFIGRVDEALVAKEKDILTI